MSFSFLKKETFGLRTQETFVGNKCEIFLPKSFIGKYDDRNPIAVELGDKVRTMGLFWFKVDDRDWYELQLPLKFEFKFSEKYKKRLRLKEGLPEDDYYVYVLNNGDAFVYDILHKKDLEDLRTDFIDKLVEKAKLPSYISYSDSLNVFIKAMVATEFSDIGIPGVSIELMLSELYRDKHNLGKPFRMVYNGKNPYGYRMVSLTKVPQLNSTFTGLIGQDIQNQLVSAILRNREGVKERPTPIEKIIKY